MVDTPIAYTEGKKTVIRASAIGGCTKALVAARMGYQGVSPPGWLQGKFDESSELEWEVGERAQESIGYPVMRPEESRGAGLVEWSVGKNIVVRGHVDGWVAVGWPYQVFEAKALGKDLFGKWKSKGMEAFPYYAAQLTVYMKALETGAYFVVLNKDTGEVDWEFFEKEEYPYSLGELRVKALAVAKEEDLPEVCDVDMGIVCPFPYLHTNGDEEGEEMWDKLRTLAEEYHEVREKAKWYEERKKEIGKEIKSQLDEEGVEKAIGDGVSVKKVKQTRKKWLEKKMREDGIDPDEYREPYEIEFVNVEVENG